MSEVLVGTRDGIHVLGGGPPEFSGRRIMAMAPAVDGVWVIAGEASVGFWSPVGLLETTASRGRFFSALAVGEAAWIGTGNAGLVRAERGTAGITLSDDETGFAAAPGRASWYTPWGGPPSVRSLSRDCDGTLYANVHVGGIQRLRPGGSWEPTIDIEADVHQVVAHPDRPGVVAAATARGLAISHDGADSWRFVTAGLHAAYCRAVAVDGPTVYVSASRGPGGRQAAVYRGTVDGDELERCTEGLPEWFATNVDSHCVAAGDGECLAADGGTAYRSADAGETWTAVAADLPPVTCLAVW